MKSIHDPRYLHFIKELVVLREQQQATQTELAKMLRRPQSYVAKIENLDRRIDVLELVDWLKALGVSPQDFMTRLPWWLS